MKNNANIKTQAHHKYRTRRKIKEHDFTRFMKSNYFQGQTREDFIDIVELHLSIWLRLQ